MYRQREGLVSTGHSGAADCKSVPPSSVVMSAFRATRTLLKRVPESPHTYHYQEGQTPFWRKARDILSLNPYVAWLTQ